MDQTLKDFLNSDKALMIAPAGHGKTYCLAQCVKELATKSEKPQLILTHTHAAIASIKSKFSELGVASKNFQIFTITGFAQRIVLSLNNRYNLPDQGEDANLYFEKILEKVCEFIDLKNFKYLFKISYSNLLVDEYQDCTTLQHKMILKLSELVNTYIFGDELQGIFNFKNKTELVSFKDLEPDFQKFENVLTTPWRWCKKGNSKSLGITISKIRNDLLSNSKQLDLSKYKSKKSDNLFIHEYNENNDEFDKLMYKLIGDGCKSKSFLLLVPPDITRYSISSRSKMKNRFDYKNKLKLLEAIDDNSFYKSAKAIDELLQKNIDNDDKYNLKKSFCEILVNELKFIKKSLDVWINKKYNVKNKKDIDDKQKSIILEEKYNNFLDELSTNSLYDLLIFLLYELKLKVYRKEILEAIINVLKNDNSKSLYENMKDYKNMIRHIGRRVEGRYFGTTLLTKGLEFDVVGIVNAHEFKSKKHFYVAISRACKELIIISKEKIIEFDD